METYSTNNNPSVVSDYDVFGQSIMVRGSEALKCLAYLVIIWKDV